MPTDPSEQVRRQLRLEREARKGWAPLLAVVFGVGLIVSASGFVVSVARFREEGSPWLRVAFFGFFAVYCAMVVARSLIPFRPKPRIVPYFPRELEPSGGGASAAFWRGRGLFRELGALDALAGESGVTPLSAFGFAYDHYGQAVEWHPAAEGLKTVEALRRALGGRAPAAPEVARDLETLAAALQAAAARGVDFSLVLRLHATDSLQGVMTREDRQGSFW